MELFNKLIGNIKTLTTSKQVGVGNAAEIGYAGTNQGVFNQDTYNDEFGRQAAYPDWFFTARLGQPRGADLREVRKFGRSPWVQMVLNTFKKQIYSMDWDIFPADEDDETDYTEDIKTVKEKLMNINLDGQTINDINSETITDVGEIDAGVLNLVYTSDSYYLDNLPVYDAYGREVGTEPGLILKPLGQRELVAIKTVDGASFLKQVDIYKNLQRYYQYSFKHPRFNPTPFEPEEIIYYTMNKRPYSVYGFSPVQAAQQVLDVLIQGTRYNKDLYHNNAIPDLLISLPKLPKDQLKKLKRSWNNRYKNKPHQVGFINWAIENIHKLVESNRDLEWLEGQKWYHKVVFGVFGVSPEEAGFFENSNKATGETQERVTVRNALKPYLLMLEQGTKKIITEILKKEDHGLEFKYIPKDQVEEKLEFEQNMQELDRGIITVNEYRRMKGKDDVEWGDEPLRKPFDPAEAMNSLGGGFGNDNPNMPNNPKDNPKNNSKDKLFKKKFEVFMNGRRTNS